MKLDKKLVLEIWEKNIKAIKVFFYEAGCSGKKVDLLFEDFSYNDLEEIETNYDFQIFAEKDDIGHFENCSITRVQKADHTWNIKTRYIYTSNEVLDRCGCGTSFAFEKKKLTFNLDSLKNLKNNFSK